MIFNKKHIIILLVFISTLSFASTFNKLDSLNIKSFLPDYVKLQYAGGTGFISVGVGYTFINQKLDVTMLYGYVPNLFTVKDLHSISLQSTVKLLKFKINDNIEISPLNLAWNISHTFGSEYWIKMPDIYPDGYYWWSPGLIGGPFIENRIKIKKKNNKTPISETAFYVRVGTRGLYLSSIWGNSSIPIKDILELGFGVIIYR